MEVKIRKGAVVELEHGDTLLDNGACVQFWSNHRNGVLTKPFEKLVRESSHFRAIVDDNTLCTVLEFTTIEGLQKEAKGLPYNEFIKLPALSDSHRVEMKGEYDMWCDCSIIHSDNDKLWVRYIWDSHTFEMLVNSADCLFRRIPV